MDALDTLDWGSRRLVPLTAWRLREAAVEGAEASPLRADLAASMLFARERLAAFSDVLEIFEQTGIDVLVLKGIGIAPLAYPDPGTRPASDLDVLVRMSQVPMLDALIEARGERRSYDSVAPALRTKYRHAADARIAGRDVDVHWRLLVDRFDGQPDEALFDRARAVQVGRVGARTLAVEDHIVHSIGHGIRRNALAPVRWIADVARLVECQPVDWSLVEAVAASRHLEGIVGRGLDLLDRDYAVPVPRATLTALRRASGLTRGRAEMWSRSAKRTRLGGAVNVAAVHYTVATRGWPLMRRLTRYPEYVRFRMLVGDRDGAHADPGARHWYG